MLKFNELHIGFKQRGSVKDHVLFTIDDLELKAGDFVALIGPNGSGKTTFFNTLLGLYPNIGGEVYFKDEDLLKVGRLEKPKIISFVPSKFSGVNHLSVYDLIAMGRAPYTNILNQLTEKDKIIVEEVMKQLNLSSYADKDTLTLSDGERQISLIGKALAQQSNVMILDEPTAFLDYSNKRKILRVLREISKKHQKIILISSHDLALCFEYCNRIVAIDTNNKQLIDYPLPFDNEQITQRIFAESE